MRHQLVTINANTAAPTCYVLTLDEVKAAVHRGENAAGTVSYWLQPKSYALPEIHEAWDRLGSSVSRGAIPDWDGRSGKQVAFTGVR